MRFVQMLERTPNPCGVLLYWDTTYRVYYATLTNIFETPKRSSMPHPPTVIGRVILNCEEAEVPPSYSNIQPVDEKNWCRVRKAARKVFPALYSSHTTFEDMMCMGMKVVLDHEDFEPATF
jgi:hypothetical protein